MWYTWISLKIKHGKENVVDHQRQSFVWTFIKKIFLILDREVLVLPPLDREIVIQESKSGPRNLHRMSLVDLGKRLLEAAIPSLLYMLLYLVADCFVTMVTVTLYLHTQSVVYVALFGCWLFCYHG
jgi:hypothetical protein